MKKKEFIVPIYGNRIVCPTCSVMQMQISAVDFYSMILVLINAIPLISTDITE